MGSAITKEQEFNDYVLNTKKNAIKKLEELDIKTDIIEEMVKHKGVISGSFMFNCFTNNPEPQNNNYFGRPIDFNDIDVYFHDTSFVDNKYNTEQNQLEDKNSEQIFYHPFEKYIIDNYASKIFTKDSYLFMKGMVYSRTYIMEKVNINFILLSEPCVEYIQNNFDLDCCKIIYDGTDVILYKTENLINGISGVKYNDCSKENLYQNGPCYHESFSSYRLSELCKNQSKAVSHALRKSTAYKNFMKLCEVYKSSKSSKSSSNILRRHLFEPEEYRKYKRYIDKISNIINFDELYNKIIDYGVSKLDIFCPFFDDVIKVISIIRTLERMDKYSNRGIKDFIFDSKTEVVDEKATLAIDEKATEVIDEKPSVVVDEKATEVIDEKANNDKTDTN